MTKKSIIFTLFLLGFFFFLLFTRLPINAQITCDGVGSYAYDPCAPPPPPPNDPYQQNPNPTSAVSAQNRKCWDAGGNLITDDCVPCGSAVASNCTLEGACGSCGGSNVNTGCCQGEYWGLDWLSTDTKCSNDDQCHQQEGADTACIDGICKRPWWHTKSCAEFNTNYNACAAYSGGSGYHCTWVCAPPNTPPQATMNCPSSPVNVGQTVTLQVNATDADNNLYSAGIYFSPTASQSWSRLNNDGSLGTDLTPNIGLSGGSRTITATWQPTTNDANKTFYVVPQIYDSSGKKCTSNPWGNPAGFVNCSSPPENSRCTIQVLGYPNCRNLSVPGTALVGDTVSITATYENGSAPAVTDAGVTILSNSPYAGHSERSEESSKVI